MLNTMTGYSKPSINISYCSYLNYDHLNILNSPTLSSENLKLTGFTLRTSPLPLLVSSNMFHLARSSEELLSLPLASGPPRSSNAAGRSGYFRV